jgi:hypothetical protein
MMLAIAMLSLSGVAIGAHGTLCRAFWRARRGHPVYAAGVWLFGAAVVQYGGLIGLELTDLARDGSGSSWFVVTVPGAIRFGLRALTVLTALHFAVVAHAGGLGRRDRRKGDVPA